ncbi:MAG: PRC-barrel domain-containing protein [Verrucomicrobiota bacterium]
MRNTQKLLLTGVTAACFGLSSPIRADHTPDHTTPGAVGNPSAHNDILKTDRTATDTLDSHSQLSDRSGQQTPVSRANKASSLIGMDVRNTQNERLGEIKDIVVDLPSGKVLYTVVSVGGFLGIGDRYVAVPPGAFSTSPEMDRLVLNADKAKLQNAPAFAKNTWPDLNDKSWNLDSYWLPGTSGQGTIGATTSGTGSSDRNSSSTAVDRDRNSNSEYPRQHANRANGILNQNGSPRNDAALDHKDVFHGKIAAIDVENRTVTVQGTGDSSGTRQFKFTDKPNIVLKESRNPSLSDFKVGYPVDIGFHDDNGTFMAHSIMRTDAPEVR